MAATVATLVGAVAGLLGITGAAGGLPWERRTGPGPADGAGPPVSAVATPPSGASQASPSGGSAVSPAAPAVAYPVQGTGTWRTAPGRSRIFGSAGRLLDFRVAVEKGISGADAVGFADAAVRTLGDPRGWTGDGRWRLRRVGPGDRADFTIYLATPATRDTLCGSGYDRYTSCRNGDAVVINVARWVHGVPHFGLPLDAYRHYVISHEVGHRLGYGHELCPGRGRPAPVMQQQTLGLHGCVANPWPLRGGDPYHGESGAYDDPIPTG